MFKSILLYTNQLKSLKRFYQHVMEFNVTANEQDQFTMQIGDSAVIFKQSSQPAFYHFAINIPGNQFSLIKYWMKNRITLNRENGRDAVYFQNFDADSMYFEDPAGNIVELIARRNRDLFGDVSVSSFLNVSEMSITTPFVVDVGESLLDIGIPLRGGTNVDPNELNFLGKGDHFIVLVPPGRRWYFSKKKSETYPLEMTLVNGQQLSVDKNGKLSLSTSI